MDVFKLSVEQPRISDVRQLKLGSISILHPTRFFDRFTFFVLVVSWVYYLERFLTLTLVNSRFTKDNETVQLIGDKAWNALIVSPGRPRHGWMYCFPSAGVGLWEAPLISPLKSG